MKQGTYVTGVKVIAKGKKIREVNRLIETYRLPNGKKTLAKDWMKMRGTAVVTDGKIEHIGEVHWYQCKNIGKVEWKVK